MKKVLVGRVEDFPPRSVSTVEIKGQKVAIFNEGGRFHAMIDRCPHEGAALSKGLICNRIRSTGPGVFDVSGKERVLRCPWHGWEFSLEDGRAVADHRSVGVRAFAVRSEQGTPGDIGRYPVRSSDGFVMIDMAEAPTLTLRVASRQDLTDDVTVLELQHDDGTALPDWEAGAHVDLYLAGGMVRQYSLCGDPADRRSWRIAVLRHRASRGGSWHIHERVARGQAVRVGYPRQRFPLHGGRRPVVLIAGGIGLTPLVAMAWRLWRIARDFRLHVITRGPALFDEELSRAPFATRVLRHNTDYGRPDPADLVEAEAEVYVCGPAGLVMAVAEARRRLGHPPKRFHTERFDAEADLEGPPFELVAAASGVTTIVPSGRSMADMLREAAVEVPTSCGAGHCGTCVVPVIEGTPDHRDSVLTASQRAAGDRVALCCSRATGRLIVDI